MPNRHNSTEAYRYGFNGMEKDDEVKNNTGTHLDFGARAYDSRLGRWMSVDRGLVKPYLSPYQFGRLNPIVHIDPDGNDDYHFFYRYVQQENGTIVKKLDYYVVETDIAPRFYMHYTEKGLRVSVKPDGSSGVDELTLKVSRHHRQGNNLLNYFTDNKKLKEVVLADFRTFKMDDEILLIIDYGATQRLNAAHKAFIFNPITQTFLIFMAAPAAEAVIVETIAVMGPEVGYVTKKIYDKYKKRKKPKTDRCFIAGTKITMADGSIKNIENVQVGDSILSMNVETSVIEAKEVLAVVSPLHKKMIQIGFSNGVKNTNTFDHPYYVLGKGWCSFDPLLTYSNYGLSADNILIGDTCFYYKNGILSNLIVVSLEEQIRDVRTYNLQEIADNHNFFANGILVHNKSDQKKKIKKNKDSSKNEKHGDQGRTNDKIQDRLKDLDEKIKNAPNKKVRNKLKKTKQRIIEDAQQKAKGQEHSKGKKI